MALFLFAPSAQAADERCSAAAYGLPRCDSAIEEFLDRLQSCHKGSAAAYCKTLGCDYGDLMRKYHGEEKTVQMIQHDMAKITGPNAPIDTACK